MSIFLAFILDLFLGDPIYTWHPVRLMGIIIEKAEGVLRQTIKNEKLAGAVLALGLPMGIFILVLNVLFLLVRINPWLAWGVNILGIYTTISISDLRKEAMQIYFNVQENDISSARKHLSGIVGRDTQDLSEQEVVRGCVETVAESTVDGIIAPIFYAVLGGAPLALAYKAVNTLDSMIGYRNARYKNFGYFAAKQDDLFNWIPARISYVVISVAAIFKGNVKMAMRIGWHDGVTAGYGNSAIAEATFAGALEIELGGCNFYQGQLFEKPFLGISKYTLDAQVIKDGVALMSASAWTMMLLTVVIM